MFSTADTITAIATPPGHGGIGVVRLSGEGALRIAGQLLATDRPLVPRYATFTRVVVPEEEEAGAPTKVQRIDHAVVTFFPAPHSYTGEDVVEISAHGSPVVLQSIVSAAMEHGARLAEPGEFTLRAYLNGRMDLVQAEAVRDLVDAVTPLQARAAFDQLEGTLTAAIGAVEERLFDLIARLEASIDFPDEAYHFVSATEAASEIGEVRERIETLVREGRRGRLVREGREVAIAGRANVGKSTLFNHLVGSERAIVTPIAGTTRDLITETTVIEGARVSLVDTAGIREAANAVEQEGVGRARRAAAAADLVVVMLDRSRPLEAEDRELLRVSEGRPRVVVVNKCDLPPAWPPEECGVAACCVSLRRPDDAATVRRAIAAALSEGAPPKDVPAVTNIRHIDLLRQASAALRQAYERAEIGQAPEEIVLSDLRIARGALEEVTGRRTTDELLAHIFSRFCIGK